MVRVANWFTHLDFDRQSAVWQHWFDFLSDGHSLIRYDPRGSGLSDRNVDDFSLDRWIEDLDAVVQCAGLTRFPMIGLCQGGAVAAAYAARYPERISRLVLYDVQVWAGTPQRKGCVQHVTWRKAERVRRRHPRNRSAHSCGYTLLPRSGVDAFPEKDSLRIVELPARCHHDLWIVFRRGRVLPARVIRIMGTIHATASDIGKFE
ncbi:LysR substrate binding domain-containing protein [Roseovarius tolerans]|uniref:LysR substrate binding domain-containing protein n=1 Tax=Roseovarius tolerans TaxID=74031 RepID=A0A1H8F7Z9_9RHOB|nr:LysR substrate binding domain-containing protein [Roseovarius tolerans]